MARATHTLAALAAGSLLLVACGGDEGGSDSAVADGAREVEVVASDFAFEPTEITAEAGEDVAISLTSEDILHDITIDELDFKVVANRGDTETGGLTAEEPGTYTFYCSVPGHRGAGMEGTLTVE